MGDDSDMAGANTRWDDIDNVIAFRESAPDYLDAEQAAQWQSISDRAAETAEQPGDAPLPGCVDLLTWIDRQPPQRDFIIPGWLIRKAAGLLSGQEGVGKSLIAQQLASCVAASRSFLGLEIHGHKALYLTCEDDLDELWRRQEAINKTLGITMADLEGRLMLVSLKGELGNELGTFDSAGLLTPSLRYRQISKLAIEFGADLTILDNAAHLFTGNENARHDVATFLSLLERLSIATNGSVLLLAHPNKQHAQGNKQGNEYSGSTGWSAHVRNRLFLDWAEQDEDGNPLDGDGRVLRKSKANYGKKGEEVNFRWHEWAFSLPGEVPVNTNREMDLAAEAGRLNGIFLACLDKATGDRVPTSASAAASNYAPRVFAKMPTARGASKEALEQALQQLLHLGTVKGDCELWRRPNRTLIIGLGRA